MRRILISIFWALAVMMIAAPVFCKPRIDKVQIFTTWDENFFYVALDVSDPDIQGQAKLPNVQIGPEDDAVGIVLQTDRSRASTVNENSVMMKVSAAGGSQFSVGFGDEWQLKPITTFKYAAQRTGTLNDDQDDDIGYRVEMALPWRELGLTADVGTIMNFAIFVQMAGEHTGLLTTGANVQTYEDLSDPSKWDEVWLRGAVQPLAVRAAGRLMSNRSLTRPPVVDGRISEAEYSAKGMLELEKPSIATAHRVFRDIPIESLIFGMYPTQDVKPDADVSGWVNKPFGGVGLWFDARSAAWHRGQLMDAVRAGVDVLLLPVTAGQTDPDPVIQALAAAMQEASSEGTDHPRVAPLISPAEGAQLDRERLLQAAQWFYGHFGPGAQAQVRLPESRGGEAAIPVFADGALVMDEGQRTALDEQARAALGMHLLVIGAAGSGGLDGGWSPAQSDTGWDVNRDGWISVGTVAPAVFDGGVPSREALQVFRENWKALAEDKPDWVVVNSFSGWGRGTEVAGSSEYGMLYTDTSSVQSVLFHGGQAYSAKYLAASVPPVITPDHLSMARLVVRNVGTVGWRVQDRIRLGYRWYQGGRLYSNGIIQVPLQQDIGINRIGELTVGVAAVDQDRDPLPEGDWLLVLEMVRPDGRNFSSGGDQPLAVPVRVGAPAELAGSILGIRVPAEVMSGATYEAIVTVRNDGSQTWEPASPVRVSLEARLAHEPSLRPVVSWEAGVAEEVPPGRIAEIPVQISLKDAAGKPIIPDSSRRQTYLAFRAALAGVEDVSVQTVSQNSLVKARIYGVQLTPPLEPVIGHVHGQPTRYAIEVENTGTIAWDDSTRLLAQWYSLDGKLLVEDGGIGKIRRGVKPGEKLPVNVELYPPPYPGQYVVRWVLQVGEDLVTPQALETSSRSVVTLYVTALGDALKFVPLADYLNADVMASEEMPSDGDFDGQGNSLPAELLPPLVVPNPAPAPLYSVGLFGDGPAGGPSYGGVQSWRWVSFSWPQRGDGKNNAVAAEGQSIPVEPVAVKRVHVLAASSGGAKDARFGLELGSGAESVTVRVPDWRSPEDGDLVAYKAAYHMRPGGPRAGESYLYNVVLESDPAQMLSSIKLPSDPGIKILGITLETEPEAAR